MQIKLAVIVQIKLAVIDQTGTYRSNWRLSFKIVIIIQTGVLNKNFYGIFSTLTGMYLFTSTKCFIIVEHLDDNKK